MFFEMARLFLLLLLAALCITYAAAKCDEEIVRKIKALREGADDSKLVNSLSGEYLVVYFDAGWLTNLLKFKCIKANYEHSPHSFSVNYEGFTQATFDVAYNDGVIEFLDKDGNVQWKNYIVSDDRNVFALYTCTDTTIFSIINFAVSTVNVKASALGYSSKSIEKANEALAKVGIKNTVRLPLCPTKI